MEERASGRISGNVGIPYLGDAPRWTTTFMLMIPTTIPVVASAYCDSSSRTAIGTRVHSGTIAVDPRIIPLRSRVHIIIRRAGDWIGHFVHVQSQHMTYDADDTGGNIKGGRIDLWMPSCKDAVRWGMRKVDVVMGDIPAKKSVVRHVVLRGERRGTHHLQLQTDGDLAYWSGGAR